MLTHRQCRWRTASRGDPCPACAGSGPRACPPCGRVVQWNTGWISHSHRAPTPSITQPQIPTYVPRGHGQHGGIGLGGELPLHRLVHQVLERAHVAARRVLGGCLHAALGLLGLAAPQPGYELGTDMGMWPRRQPYHLYERKISIDVRIHAPLAPTARGRALGLLHADTQGLEVDERLWSSVLSRAACTSCRRTSSVTPSYRWQWKERRDQSIWFVVDGELR